MSTGLPGRRRQPYRRRELLSGGGDSARFLAQQATYTPGGNLIRVLFNQDPTVITVAGWDVQINQVVTAFALDSFSGNEAFFITSTMSELDTVQISYDGAGITEADGLPLEPAISEDAQGSSGELAFAAAGSLFSHSDGVLDTHILQAQSLGFGTPTFSHDGLNLPDHEGIYRAIKAGEAPWHGARMVDAGGGFWDAFDDDEIGDPLPVQPSLYTAPEARNLVIHSRQYDIGWAQNTVTAVEDQTGLDGTLSGWTVQGTAKGSTLSTALKISVTGGDVTMRAFIAKSGSTATQMYLEQANVWVSFNTVTGTYNSNSGAATGWDVVDHGWYWEFLTQVNYVGLSTVKVYPDFSGAHNPVVVLQMELHDGKTINQVRGTAPIYTGAAAVTDKASFITYSILNHADDQGCYYLEVALLGGTVSGDDGIIGTDVTGRIMYYNAPTEPRSWDGTNLAGVADPFVAGVFKKMGVSYGAPELMKRLTVDGASDEGVYVGAWGGTAVYVGGYVGMNLPRVNSVALIRNIRRYNLNYTDAKLKIDELMV